MEHYYYSGAYLLDTHVRTHFLAGSFPACWAVTLFLSCNNISILVSGVSAGSVEAKTGRCCGTRLSVPAATGATADSTVNNN